MLASHIITREMGRADEERDGGETFLSFHTKAKLGQEEELDSDRMHGYYSA